MPRRDAALLLEDIRSAIARIERYTSGLQREQFLADEKTVDAVARNLEIIGEAVRWLPDDFKREHEGLPWEQIAGLQIESSTTTSVWIWRLSGKSCRPLCLISESSSRESRHEVSDQVTAVRRLIFSSAIRIPQIRNSPDVPRSLPRSPG